MKRERYFDLFLDVDDLEIGSNWRTSIGDALTSRLRRGGYCVAFLSTAAVASEYAQGQLRLAFEQWPSQILPVLLEPEAMQLIHMPFESQAKPIFLDKHEPGKINWNRVDDLIVQIYRLVFEGSGAKLP